MSKKTSFISEIIFYLAITIATIFKIVDAQFVIKEIGVYLYCLVVITTFVFIRSVYLQKDLKRKDIILILIPIIAILSMNIFVYIGGVFLSFGVFSRYERTKFNKRMKVMYALFVGLTFIVFFMTVVSTVGVIENFARYESYEVSPDSKNIITVVEIGEFPETSYAYTLEKIYLRIFRKEKYVLVNHTNSNNITVDWLSNERVRIKDVTYTIEE